MPELDADGTAVQSGTIGSRAMSIHQRQAGGCSGRSPRAWPRFSASCGRASTTSTDGSRPAALYGAIGLAGLAITVSGIVVGLIILSKAG